MAAAAETNTAPILRRPRNFQWYWKSGENPWSTSAPETWTKYTDVENEIIEDAYKTKKSQIEIDGGYIVSFNDNLQYGKLDKKKQRPIKRVTLSSNRQNNHLREERFSLPFRQLVANTTTSENDKDVVYLPTKRTGGDFPRAYENEINHGMSIADVVEAAALGIIEEGTKVGKPCEAQWLAEQLRSVKHLGKQLDVKFHREIPDSIGQTCVFLYTKESFWYKLINSILRGFSDYSATTTRQQLKTLGPFCYLLSMYLNQTSTTKFKTVYRGVTLTDEQRQNYLEEHYLKFTAFTSTTVNRTKAEEFGNTLFIIDLDVEYSYANGIVRNGADISSLSDFPDEEEFLIWPSSAFRITKHEFDGKKNKHLIYIESCDMDP